MTATLSYKGLAAITAVTAAPAAPSSYTDTEIASTKELQPNIFLPV